MNQYNSNTSHSQKISLKNPIDFRSDTVTLPSNEMLQGIENARLGDDVYGEDQEVNDLQEYAAKLLDKEAALFFPSGTQSNLTAMLSHCQRGDEVLVYIGMIIFSYEDFITSLAMRKHCSEVALSATREE